jgi:hypothetical protein
MKKSILITILFFLTTTTRAQQMPEVGKSLPDIYFDNVQYYAKKSVSSKDFRGKWLFLNFWYSGCSSDVKSLHEVDALQKQFKNDIQFFMICMNEKRYHSEFAFTKLTERYKFTLPAAFDSTLHMRWKIWSVPYIVVVDPLGIVRGITNGQDVTSQKIKDLVDGKNVSFHKRRNGTTYDAGKLPGTADSTLVYRFILTKWKGEWGGSSNLDRYVESPPDLRSRGIQAVDILLADLYAMAYWGFYGRKVVDTKQGLIFPLPIIEVRNDSLFRTSDINEYTFNLSVRPDRNQDIEFIKHTLQGELKNAFGYEVVLEKRKMEVWRLLAKPGALEKLKSKGGTKKLFYSPAGMELQNAPISLLCKNVIDNLASPDRIFIDKNETGYDGNIDIRIDAIMTDLDDVQAVLKKHGLGLVKEPAEVNVIVIRDPSDE